MRPSHARRFYVVAGEGERRVHGAHAGVELRGDVADASLAHVLASAADTPVEYDRVFSEEVHADPAYAAALTDLGEGMFAPRPMPQPPLHGTIPAGYTYLGQFIAHELTWARDGGGPLPLNHRDPRFDLDSVFDPPAATCGNCPAGHAGPLPVGETAATLSLPAWRGDLPRTADGDPIIADARNDDALPLAQVHQLLLRFYNRVAAHLGLDGAGADQGAVRRTVRQHVQSVVLYDYLPRLVGTMTWQHVMTNGRAKFHPHALTDATTLRLPLEFAVAAFRFGHAMIRGSYPHWNAVHSASLHPFWHFTRHSRHPAHADGPMRRLPSDWATNWLRLFDVADTGYAGEQCEVLMARRIDTRLTGELAHVPDHVLRDDTAPSNLALRTLLRGLDLGLACGQTVVSELNDVLDPADHIVPLTEPELLDAEPDAVRAALQAAGGALLHATPLWFYVLKEAAVRGAGSQLGPAGGRLVMETVHAAIEHSPDAIAPGSGWKPALPCADPARFTMADLLVFTGALNPIGGCRPSP